MMLPDGAVMLLLGVTVLQNEGQRSTARSQKQKTDISQQDLVI